MRGDILAPPSGEGPSRIPRLLRGPSPAAAALLLSRSPLIPRATVVCPDLSSAEAFAGDLSFFLGGRRVYLLPPLGNSPLERDLPDPDREAQRLQALWAMARGDGPLVLPAPSLPVPILPPAQLQEAALTLKPGGEVDRDAALAALSAMGYQRRGTVTEVGEMSVRGGILDAFPPHLPWPVRLELWGDEVQSLRFFDPETQRSQGVLEELTLLPVSEFLRGEERTARGKAALTAFFSSRAVPAREREQILALWEEGSDFPGLGSFLPLLCGTRAFPLGSLPPGAPLAVVDPDGVSRALEGFFAEAARRAAPDLPAPEEAFASPGAVRKELDRARLLVIPRTASPSSLPPSPVPEGPGGEETIVECRPPLPATLPASRPDPLAELASLLEDRERRGIRTVRVAGGSEAAARRLEEIIASLGHPLPRGERWSSPQDKPPVQLLTGSLSAGFTLPGEGLAVVAESDLFGAARETRRRRAVPLSWDSPLGILSPGDIVVHMENGIGRYEGLRQMRVGDYTGDFLHLVFAEGAALYVPVQDMAKVQRYRSAAAAPPPLSRLGSPHWQKARERVRRALRLMAEELLRLQAKRKTAPGFAFPAPDRLYREFEASFPWRETPDQEKAILEVLADMQAPRAMDRLVCGDVGYGKTEVALRAAFLAAEGGKQAAILVPTTVLAYQHFQNFTERMRPFPVRVAMLSRFASPREQREVLEGLALGKVDVVVGTHRLLSADVAFKDLGLLVVDEEHRFGVRHKEKLKRLKETVDVLTLSATPIPRTLHQAFSGLRDLSLIQTPPVDRKSVHTEVRFFEEGLIRDAVSRELDRGGQVFLVHNRVQSIESFRRMVARLVPHARITVAHGQMEEKALEEVMVRFLRREFDILLSTAIIESGLDISNANTLIINRADRFGLAQLYQLRGRVGRSSAKAYAYFLIPPEGTITSQARRRLTVLREMTDLGSGFKVATYDMEIRGAGNLLGEEQSGNITSVGLDLYTQLLEQALLEAAGKAPEIVVEPQVALDIPAYLPEEYLPDVGERLTLYKRLSGIRGKEELEALREEAADRFGRLPGEVLGLFLRREIELAARGLGLERLDSSGPVVFAVFHPQARVSPDALVGLLTRDRRVRFIPPATLKVDLSGVSPASDRVPHLKDILLSLGSSASQTS